MPDWDADSTTLRNNLKHTLRSVRDQATERHSPHADDAKDWHVDIMKDLQVPEPRYIGRFRGEQGLHDIQVIIGQHRGVEATEVSTAISRFETHFQKTMIYLDKLIPAGKMPDANTLDAVLDVCGWVHAEWIRIHPFANGNGRTARLWANYVAMRYGLPPFVRLRPRPDGEAYASAGKQAMTGKWEPTAELFRDMLAEFLNDSAI